MINKEMQDWTVSNLFLVPILDIPRPKLRRLGFINSYLFNGEEDVVYENALHLLFKPADLPLFNQFCYVEQFKKRAIDVHDYPGGFVVMTYALPTKYTEDYKKIWEGRYTQVSAEFRALIPSTVKYINSKGYPTTNVSVQHMIIDRYELLKKYWETEFDVKMDDDQELWTKPTTESETFKLKNHEPITVDA